MLDPWLPRVVDEQADRWAVLCLLLDNGSFLFRIFAADIHSQNPEFRNDPEKFHPCKNKTRIFVSHYKSVTLIPSLFILEMASAFLRLLHIIKIISDQNLSWKQTI